MTRFDQLDKALQTRGWHYDAANEEFCHGAQALYWENAVGVVPDFTLDELASYQDYKQDELRSRLAKVR